MQPTEVVPGDLILIESGDIVPADSVLINSNELQINESILTGESIALKKKISDYIYRGTFVNSGNGTALVKYTGMQTKVGKIASKFQKIKEERTAFQEEISKFSRSTLWFILGIILIIFFISIFRYNFYQSLMMSIALAVAAIPEGLPAVLVLVLAIGAKIMANKNAVIRKLGVIESIGSVDIICTDKTGTLTKNDMTVTKLFLNNKELDVSKNLEKEAEKLILCGALCNNASIAYDKDGKIVHLGDQTDVALKKISEKFKLYNKIKNYKRVKEIPFTSKRKIRF